MSKCKSHFNFNKVLRMLDIEDLTDCILAMESANSIKHYRIRYRGPRKGNRYNTLKQNATHFTVYIQTENI